MKTITTSERRSSQSRIYACWRVIFAIVGVLDCSCFCYCYYHHNNHSGDTNSTATKKKQPPRSCPSQEGWQEHDLQRQHSRRDIHRGDDSNSNTNSNANASTAFENGGSCDAKTKPLTTETSLSSPFQRRKGLSWIVWQSMAFSHHPTDATIFIANADIITGTKTLHGRLEDSINAYFVFLLLHLGFGILCGIEMIIRAIEARRIFIENQAIAAFEEHIAATVAKVYHQRTKLLSAKGQFSYYNLRRPASFLSPNRNKNENIHYDDDGNTKDRDQNNEEDNISHGENNDDGTTDMDDEAANKRNILLFLRSTFRPWVPIAVTCVFWLSLLPFQAYYQIIRIFLNKYFNHMPGNLCTDGNGGRDNDQFMDGGHYCDIDMDCSHPYGSDAAAACYVETLGDDTAWATLWITTFLGRWTKICEEIQDYLISVVWKRYLLGDLFRTHTQAQKKLHKILLDKPKLIWFRLGRILSIVKWVRFAFPLARMALKLQDQLRAGYSTFQKVRSVRTNRERRLQRPSLLLRDLRRIESFHKVETTIAAWPSQCSMLLDTLAKEASQFSVSSVKMSTSMANAYAEEFLRKSRERGMQITRQIQWLQGQLKRGVTEISSSEIYDSLLRLSKDMSKRHLSVDHGNLDHEESEDCDSDNGNENKPGDTGGNSHRKRRSPMSRWYDFLHIERLLSSRDYLISPRSRFSVVWRITVTNCLFLELTRLSVSWYMTQTFHLSISQVIGRLFVDCGTIQEDTKRKFRFFTDLIKEWHTGLSRAIPFVPFPKETLWILCVPTSPISKLLLFLGLAMETFVDVVSFLDIFFWFFTGDLNASTGIVVPKAFFGRCILPGTLVQVIDHPTLPDFLPSVLGKLAVVTAELGWSRLVLWSCALIPALVAEVIVPLYAYFFRHFEETNDGVGGGGKNDLLMTYAESFGYLPTHSSRLLNRTPAAHRLIREARTDDPSSESHSSSDDDDKNNNDFIDEGLIRRSFYGRSPIPPGSPRLSALRGATSLRLHDSSVRFAKDVSMVSDDDPQLYGSAADFDIGLSLSSHALHGIRTPPGSPRRTSLRGATSPQRLHDSIVRFAKNASMTSDEDEDGSVRVSPRLYGSEADFDIGLSLSSHTLYDLNDLNDIK